MNNRTQGCESRVFECLDEDAVSLPSTYSTEHDHLALVAALNAKRVAHRKRRIHRH